MFPNELLKSLPYTLPEGDRREDLLLRAGSSAIAALAKIPDETPIGVRYDEITKKFVNDNRLFVSAPSLKDISPWVLAETHLSPSFFYNDVLCSRRAFSFSGNQGKFTARLVIEDGYPLIEDIDETQEIGNVIIKPWSGQYRFLPENEFFCMMLLSEMGFCAAEPRLLRTDDGRFHFVVNRFDIEQDPDTGRAKRKRTFQFAELMELSTEEDGKYSITTEELMEFADSHITDSEELALAYIAGWALGNGDMHAKNFSVYHDRDGKYRMTPLYDMLNTIIYNKLPDRLALPFGECCHPSPSGEDFLGYFADRYDVDFIERCADRLSHGYRRMDYLLKKMLPLCEENPRRVLFLESLAGQITELLRNALRDAEHVCDRLQNEKLEDTLIEFER